MAIPMVMVNKQAELFVCFSNNCYPYMLHCVNKNPVPQQEFDFFFMGTASIKEDWVLQWVALHHYRCGHKHIYSIFFFQQLKHCFKTMISQISINKLILVINCIKISLYPATCSSLTCLDSERFFGRSLMVPHPSLTSAYI